MSQLINGAQYFQKYCFDGRRFLIVPVRCEPTRLGNISTVVVTMVPWTNLQLILDALPLSNHSYKVH